MVRKKYPHDSHTKLPKLDKISFSGIAIPGQEIQLPPLLVYRGANKTVHLRYRVQKEYFPNNCNKCHGKIKPDQDCVICARSVEINEHKKRQRERAQQAAAQEKKHGKAKASAAGDSSHQGRPVPTVDKIQRQRERKKVVDQAKKQGVCEFFALGGCRNAAQECRHGKHTVLV